MQENDVVDASLAIGFTRRLRTVRPFQLLIVLFAAFGTRTTRTIADVVRLFNLMTGESVAYKAFHNQLRKPEFALWTEEMLLRLVASLTQQALRAVRSAPLRSIKDIIIQDCTWFVLRDELAKEFPGKYVDKAPAALAVHTTLSLYRGQPLAFTLAGSAHSEQRYRPDAADLQGCLFIADRGYKDRQYCLDLHRAGARFIIRFPNNVNPWVSTVWLDHRRLRKPPADRLVDCIRKLRGKNADLDVAWVEGPNSDPIRMRLVLRWNPTTEQHTILVTNLPRSTFTPATVGQLYRLRWQIELVFKEWKSYANLHAFETRFSAIAKGFVWASIAAAVLKRFLTYAAQRVHATELSTHRAALAIGEPLFALLAHFLSRSGIRGALRHLLAFLSSQARRANPKRDRARGRLAVGLAPAFAESG
jgi:hypothetical protein